MPEAALQMVLRTPAGAVFEEPVLAVRVPTHSGQVGLRPGTEPLVLIVETGLILMRQLSGPLFVGSAGGILEAERDRALLLSPFIVWGTAASEVSQALERQLATPDSELAARRRLGELEGRVLRELQLGPTALGATRRAT